MAAVSSINKNFTTISFARFFTSFLDIYFKLKPDSSGHSVIELVSTS